MQNMGVLGFGLGLETIGAEVNLCSFPIIPFSNVLSY